MPPRVFTIAPGAPFLATFAQALLDGEVIEGLSGASGPLALAKAKIYVPTRRAGRAFPGHIAHGDNHAVDLGADFDHFFGLHGARNDDRAGPGQAARACRRR